jgi:hypothetical protein
MLVLRVANRAQGLPAGLSRPRRRRAVRRAAPHRPGAAGAQPRASLRTRRPRACAPGPASSTTMACGHPLRRRPERGRVDVPRSRRQGRRGPSVVHRNLGPDTIARQERAAPMIRRYPLGREGQRSPTAARRGLPLRPAGGGQERHRRVRSSQSARAVAPAGVFRSSGSTAAVIAVSARPYGARSLSRGCTCPATSRDKRAALNRGRGGADAGSPPATRSGRPGP